MGAPRRTFQNHWALHLSLRYRWEDFSWFFWNTKALPGSSAGKESACSVGGLGSISGSGRFPGGKHGNPLQYSCLLNPHRACWATAHGVTKSGDMTERLSTHMQGYLPQVELVVKNLPANAGDVRDAGSIPGLGRSLGGWHGNPLQYPCLENPMDRGAWWAIIHGVAQSRTLSNVAHKAIPELIVPISSEPLA